MDRERWLDLTDQLLILERQIKKVGRELHLEIEPLLEIHENIQRLMTAPGVGLLTAATVLTETGGNVISLRSFNSPSASIVF